MNVTFTPATLSIPHEEIDGYPKEIFSRTSLDIVRLLQCPWEDRLSLAQDLVGQMVASGNNFEWIMPARYSYFVSPGQTSVPCLVTRVEINGFGKSDKGAGDTPTSPQISYSHARLHVTYTSVPEADIDILVEETMDPTAEFLTLPSRKAYWDNAQEEPLSKGEAPGLLLKSFEWTYKINQCPLVPAAAFDLVGKVNSDAIWSRKFNHTFPAETLLYTPPELTEFHDFSGQALWEIVYKFNYKPLGWNLFYRGGASGPDGETYNDVFYPQVIYDNSGKVIKGYDAAPFADLFLS